jgi:hypothetical protein
MGAGVRVLFRYGVLHVDGTLHGIDGAGEVRDKAVTSRAKDPTAMRGDQAVDNGPNSVRVRRVPTSSSPISRL